MQWYVSSVVPVEGLAYLRFSFIGNRLLDVRP